MALLISPEVVHTARLSISPRKPLWGVVVVLDGYIGTDLPFDSLVNELCCANTEAGVIVDRTFRSTEEATTYIESTFPHLTPVVYMGGEDNSYTVFETDYMTKKNWINWACGDSDFAPVGVKPTWVDSIQQDFANH